jgi:hypothetical protein
MSGSGAEMQGDEQGVISSFAARTKLSRQINGQFEEDECARFVEKVRDILLAAQGRFRLGPGEEKRMGGEEEDVRLGSNHIFDAAPARSTDQPITEREHFTTHCTLAID